MLWQTNDFGGGILGPCYLLGTTKYLGMWKGKLVPPPGHAHTSTLTVLGSNCPLPAFRTNFVPPCVLPDSHVVLLVGNSAYREPRTSTTHRNRPSANDGGIHTQQLILPSLSGHDRQIFYETRLPAQVLETRRCTRECCTDTSSYPRPPDCLPNTTLEL